MNGHPVVSLQRYLLLNPGNCQRSYQIPHVVDALTPRVGMAMHLATFHPSRIANDNEGDRELVSVHAMRLQIKIDICESLLARVRAFNFDKIGCIRRRVSDISDMRHFFRWHL